MQPIEDFGAEDALLGQDRTEENPILKEIPPQHSNLTKRYSTSKKIFLLMGFLSALAYLIYLSLKLTNALSQGAFWSYSSIPLLLAMIMFTEVAIISVYNPRRQIKTLARLMILTLVYATVILMLIFNLLLCLQADSFINARFILLFLPLFILSAFVFHFMMFLLPGFLDTENRFYKEATLLIAYFVAGVLTLILLSFKLDVMINWRFAVVLAPLFLAIMIHTVFLILNAPKEITQATIREIVVLLFAFTFLILITINLENKSTNKSTLSWFAVLSPVYFLLLAGTFGSLSSLVKRKRAI